MSASDYTSLCRTRAQNGLFGSRESGISTTRAQINTIKKTVVLDEYEDVVPNDWFGVPIDPPDCTNCATIDVKTAARREDSTAPPLYSVQSFTYMKNRCNFVVVETTDTVIPITVSSVEIMYDSSANGYVLIFQQ
jgi:hypothetical protein